MSNLSTKEFAPFISAVGWIMACVMWLRPDFLDDDEDDEYPRHKRNGTDR